MTLHKATRVVAFLLCVFSASIAHAQAITNYEVTIVRQDTPGTVVKVLNYSATDATCASGDPTIPLATVQWLVTNQSVRIEIVPTATTVCRLVAPWSDFSSLSPGVLYLTTAKQVNEAGLKSAAGSPPSNPFGVAETPPNILRVGVAKQP